MATTHPVDDVQIRNAEGGEVGSVTLAEELFGLEPNIPVLHQVVTAQLAAARRGTQSTKTRAEVSGGGKKPFKQKGTGRARQGSERAPHFIGGGIALGPKPRSYRQRTPKKMIALALRSALSDRAAEGKVVVVDAWPWNPPSTRGARQALEALGLSGKVLVVLSRDDEAARKSFRNLPHVQLLKDTELNAYDILVNDWVVFTSATLPGIRSDVVSAAEELVEAAEAAEEAEAAEDLLDVIEAAEVIEEAAELEVEAEAESVLAESVEAESVQAESVEAEIEGERAEDETVGTAPTEGTPARSEQPGDDAEAADPEAADPEVADPEAVGAEADGEGEAE
jgi:large subunit ribosomal protein L4